MKLFISYRPSDSYQITRKIYDELLTEYNINIVFTDVNSIPFGSDFRKVIDQSVAECEACLIIIDQTCLNAADEYGTRCVDNQTDSVRLELESTLQRSIPIIPILVNDASMPDPNQLPLTIQAIAFYKSIVIRTDQNFYEDTNQLVSVINAMTEISVESNFDVEAESQNYDQENTDYNGEQIIEDNTIIDEHTNISQQNVDTTNNFHCFCIFILTVLSAFIGAGLASNSKHTLCVAFGTGILGFIISSAMFVE